MLVDLLSWVVLSCFKCKGHLDASLSMLILKVAFVIFILLFSLQMTTWFWQESTVG